MSEQTSFTLSPADKSSSELLSTENTSFQDDEDCEEGCACGHSHDEGMKRHEKISLVLSGVFVALAVSAERFFGNESLMLVASLLALVAGLVIVLPETIESLKARSIDINVLLIIAVIGALYVKAYEEAAAVLFLFSLGEYLEGRALHKSNDAIKDLAQLAPDTTLVIRKGAITEVATDQVEKGETILLKPGMAAPLDGVISKGSSSFNDAAITGESLPVHKKTGDTVFAASLAVDGVCEVTTSSTVADSTLAKITTMVKEAQQKKSSREHFVQRFAKVYTPLVIALAFLVAFVPPLLSSYTPLELGGIDVWVYRACELLVISCPCAFVISTPVTMVSALTRAAKLGVLVKGGAFFEEGARVVVAAFDKTGTLTKGSPVVTQVVLPSSYESLSGSVQPLTEILPGSSAVLSEETQAMSLNEEGATHVIEIAKALEDHSTHPLGEAVIAYANQEGIEVQRNMRDIKEIAGKGIRGVMDGVTYAVGSQVYLENDLGVQGVYESFSAEEDLQSKTTLFVAKLDSRAEMLGAIVVSDVAREDTAPVLERLHRLGKGLKTVMLTGDKQQVALSLATQVGIDEVHASLLPQEKTAEIQRLQKEVGPVAYTGDGINDAPSLAAADLGIAMGGAGSAAALSSADVVLMADDLTALPRFFSLSAKTVQILKQNVVLAIGLKALVAVLVVMGVAQMWMAVLADTGVSLLVIGNGMRLLRTRLS